MNNVGIVKGDVCSTSAMPSPKDVKAISKFVDVYIQSDAGIECGYSDNEYALEGCFIRDNSEEVIASANLILFQNIDLYTFEAINDGTGEFKDKFVNFISFRRSCSI